LNTVFKVFKKYPYANIFLCIIVFLVSTKHSLMKVLFFELQQSATLVFTIKKGGTGVCSFFIKESFNHQGRNVDLNPNVITWDNYEKKHWGEEGI